MELLYIHWNPDPILFSIAGIAIRWYSIFWFIAILAGSQVVYKLYQSKGLPVDTFQNLFLYSFLGIFIGARLGHCLFYEPDYYLSHPLEIVLPVHFYPDGDWKFTGYAGLASHGGTLGLIIALAIFCRKTKIHYLDILDMMGIAAPLAAGFIRLANLMKRKVIQLKNIRRFPERNNSSTAEYREIRCFLPAAFCSSDPNKVRISMDFAAIFEISE